jgi:hypothetical protein
MIEIENVRTKGSTNRSFLDIFRHSSSTINSGDAVGLTCTFPGTFCLNPICEVMSTGRFDVSVLFLPLHSFHLLFLCAYRDFFCESRSKSRFNYG